MSTPLITQAPVALRRSPALTTAEASRADRELAHATPHDVVRWALDRFGDRVVITSSFADTVLIDIATSVDPDIEIVFLDTGFHFAETLATVRRALASKRLNLTVLQPDPDAADVWAAGSEACCRARKVDPLDRYLPDRADAWMSGLRRADHPGRAEAPIVSIDGRGLVKINPIATLDDDAYDQYVTGHDVIVNPLHFEGYASVGCWPCTEPAADGRAGRWCGTAKTECGLHL